jgi:hypothetical protein
LAILRIIWIVLCNAKAINDVFGTFQQIYLFTQLFNALKIENRSQSNLVALYLSQEKHDSIGLLKTTLRNIDDKEREKAKRRNTHLLWYIIIKFIDYLLRWILKK